MATCEWRWRRLVTQSLYSSLDATEIAVNLYKAANLSYSSADIDKIAGRLYPFLEGQNLPYADLLTRKDFINLIRELIKEIHPNDVKPHTR